MNNLRAVVATVLCAGFFSIASSRVYKAGSWQDPWNRGNLETYDPSPSHNKAGFVKGHIGNPQLGDILLYSFYVITDPHIGGYSTSSTEEDYNKPSYHPYLDTTWVDATGDHNMGDGPSGAPNGGTIGKYLHWAVQLINSHYNYGEGSGSFCVILGDVSARGERAEIQHAKIKLDSLDCPWLPVRGNHDTWPWVELTDEWAKDDRYFNWLFQSYFANHASKAFPCWYIAPVPNTPPDEPHWCNWGFNWGASRHLGLDVMKRYKGGDGGLLDYLFSVNAEMFQDYTNGTFDFFGEQMLQWHNSTSNVMMYAHAPLSWTSKFLIGTANFFPFPQFKASERTDILEEVNTYYPARTNYWFSGHAHNGSGNAYPDEALMWDVGLEASSMTTRVLFFPGIYGYEAGDGSWGDKQYYVGLVEVYGEHKCDFSYTSSSPNPPFINFGVPIQFIDECESSDGYQMPNSYYWTFGDGAASASSNPSHFYNGPIKKYYVQLKATFTSGETYETYTCKPMLIGFNYPQWGIVKVYQSSSSSALGNPLMQENNWYVSLEWWHLAFKRWDYHATRLYRNITGTEELVPGPYRQLVKPRLPEFSVEDGPFSGGQEITYRAETDWQEDNYSWQNPTPEYTFEGHPKTVTIPGDPPPPGCPEAFNVVGYDSTSAEFRFAPNNTVLAHSPSDSSMKRDLLLLENSVYDHQGFTSVILIERGSETSAFDQVKLHAVDHPKGTGVATSADGNVYCYDNMMEPWACHDAAENDYLDNVLLHPGYENSLKAVPGQEVSIKFDYPLGGEGNGLLMSNGMETEEYKDYYVCGYQEDTSGNWHPLDTAYTRSDPSEWLMKADTGETMLPSFKLQFAGEDTACINYIFLVSLVDSGWTDTTVSPTTATHWQDDGAGNWTSSDKTTEVVSIDDDICTLAPLEQLAIVFPSVATNPDTSMTRDYVFESYGVYTSQPMGSATDVEEKIEPVFTYAFDVNQVIPLSRSAVLSYQVPHTTYVTLSLYDASGRLVKPLVKEKINRGKYTIEWNGTDSKGAKVSSGVYFFRIAAGDFEETKKVVILD